MAHSSLLDETVEVLDVRESGPEDVLKGECIGSFIRFRGRWYWFLGHHTGMLPMDRGEVRRIMKHYRERKKNHVRRQRSGHRSECPGTT